MFEGKAQIRVSYACCAALATSLLLVPWDIYSLAYAHETFYTSTQVAVSGITLTAHLFWVMLQITMLAMSEEHCLVSKAAMEKVVLALTTVPFITMAAYVLQIYALSEARGGTLSLWIYLICLGWVLFPAIQLHLIAVLIQHHELFVENDRIHALLTKRVRVVCLVIACVIGNVCVCVLDPIVNNTHFHSEFANFFYVLMVLSTGLVFLLSWSRRRNIIFLLIWLTLQIMTFGVGCYIGWQIQLDFFGQATGLTQCVWLSYVAMITAAISANVLLLITVVVGGVNPASPRQAYEEMMSSDLDRL